MIRRTLVISLAVAATLQLGCAVVPLSPGPGRSKSSLSSGKPDCAPSQYWDGTMCRHKGKGHGARKHDG